MASSGFAYSQFNPCCCISIRSGVYICSIFDIIYGISYIFRFTYLEYLRQNHTEFFPANIPTPTESPFMHYMFRRGNYLATIVTGVILLLSIHYLANNDRFKYLTLICYGWMFIRVFLIISMIIFCNALLDSNVKHFYRYGYEVLFSIMLNIYYLVVIIMFLQETQSELNSTRAIKPLNIQPEEHEEYLVREKNTMFDTATNFQTLSPLHFLNAKFISEKELNTDPSVLQYIAAKSKVEVMDEDKVFKQIGRKSRKHSGLKSLVTTAGVIRPNKKKNTASVSEKGSLRNSTSGSSTTATTASVTEEESASTVTVSGRKSRITILPLEVTSEATSTFPSSTVVHVNNESTMKTNEAVQTEQTHAPQRTHRLTFGATTEKQIN